MKPPPKMKLLGGRERVESAKRLADYLQFVVKSDPAIIPALVILVFEKLDVATDFSRSCMGYQIGEWMKMGDTYVCYGGKVHKSILEQVSDLRLGYIDPVTGMGSVWAAIPAPGVEF